MSAHSSLGPSSAERWFNCPGSIALSAKCEKPPTNYSAAEGTVAHSIAEDLLTGKATLEELLKRVGTTVVQEGHEVKIITEMVEGAILYADTVKKYKDELVEMGKGATIHEKVEERVCASTIDPNLWGTADHLLFQKGNTLYVTDYKFGKREVTAKENKQMGVYTVAAMDTVAGPVFDKVALTIVQPRARSADGEVRRWDAGRDWVEEFRGKLSEAVARTKDPLAERKAGTWCAWCPAETVCPERRSLVEAEAQVEFGALPPQGGEEAVMQQMTEKAMSLDLTKLARVLMFEESIDAFIKACKDRAQAILESGGTVPGFKLVEGRSNRKWINAQAAADEFGMLYGEAVYAPKEVLSVAQMEKLVGKKQFALVSEKLVERPPGRRSIAPDTDSRPEAVSTAALDFADVPALPSVPQLPAPSPTFSASDPLGLDEMVPADAVVKPEPKPESDPLGLDDIGGTAKPEKKAEVKVKQEKKAEDDGWDLGTAAADALTRDAKKEAAAAALEGRGKPKEETKEGVVEEPTQSLEDELLAATTLLKWPV